MISALRNFEKYELSEKVDGSNIQFGYDEQGFYTSRETKGNAPRIRSVADYPIAFNTTFQRSSHAVLEKLFPLMKKSGYLKIGDSVDTEVLFGELPNAVTYSSDVNRLILLRPVNGSPDLAGLRDTLSDKTIDVVIEAPYTLDGKNIQTRKESHRWKVARTPTWSADSISKSEAWQDVKTKVDELESFLKAPSGILNFTNAELVSLPLNKRPESADPAKWKELIGSAKLAKKRINDLLFYHNQDTGEKSGFVHDLKELLLNRLVRQTRSQFGPEIEQGGWIEGVVVRDPETNTMFKLVDKDMFMVVKDFLWRVRDDLTTKPAGLARVETFAGKLLTGLGAAIGLPELGTNQAKRTLKKIGSTPEEIIEYIEKNNDFATVKQYWIKFIKQKQDEFDQILDDYNKNKGSMKITAQNREFSYNAEVDKRTLQTFANMNKQLNLMIADTQKASTMEDLVTILVGRQLKEL